MKKCISIILFCLAQAILSAQTGATLADHSEISHLSSFRIMGELDLRIQKDKTAPVAYRTLNHEGGTKVTVLERSGSDTLDGKTGLWLYILLTAPVWADNGDWIEKYRKFLIFLPDETPVFDFEE